MQRRAPSPPPQVPPLRLGPLARVLFLLVPHENPAAAVYGLIPIGGLLAVESGIRETYLDTILAAVVAAALYWLLHVYARLLGDRLRDRRPMTATTLLKALARDRSIMRGAAVPIGALLVSWLAGAGQDTGVTIALWATVGAIVAFELAAALRVQAALGELLLDGAVGITMGVGILALKIILH